MKYQPIEWRKNYAACFRPLSSQQSEAWEKFLEANIRGDLHQADIDRTVARLCETWTDLRRHPGVKDILYAIIRERSNAHGPIRALSDEERDLNHLESELRDRIRVETKPKERWEIICQGNDVDMCERLESYAETFPGGAGRPTKDEIHAIFGPCIQKLSRAFRVDEARGGWKECRA